MSNAEGVPGTLSPDSSKELALCAFTAVNTTLVNSIDSVDSFPFCLTRAMPVFAEKRLEGHAEQFTKSSSSETLSWI